MNGTHKSLADQIREFALETAVRRAKRDANVEIVIRAGDVHSDMGLQNRLPAVCAALGAEKFQRLCGLHLIRREGPHVGSNTVFYFRRISHSQTETPKPRAKAIQRTPKRSRPQPTSFQFHPDTEIWVSCVSRKRSSNSVAKDLYVSDWFTKARTLAESTGCRWRILSAKYGLVMPDQIVAPYELTLNKMGISERREWAEMVFNQLSRNSRLPKHVVLLAGARYREFVKPRLDELGIRVDVPMAGLRIGEQLQWLGEQARRVSN
jgi:hypothetical protein